MINDTNIFFSFFFFTTSSFSSFANNRRAINFNSFTFYFIFLFLFCSWGYTTKHRRSLSFSIFMGTLQTVSVVVVAENFVHDVYKYFLELVDDVWLWIYFFSINIIQKYIFFLCSIMNFLRPSSFVTFKFIMWQGIIFKFVSGSFNYCESLFFFLFSPCVSLTTIKYVFNAVIIIVRVKMAMLLFMGFEKNDKKSCFDIIMERKKCTTEENNYHGRKVSFISKKLQLSLITTAVEGKIAEINDECWMKLHEWASTKEEKNEWNSKHAGIYQLRVIMDEIVHQVLFERIFYHEWLLSEYFSIFFETV